MTIRLRILDPRSRWVLDDQGDVQPLVVRPIALPTQAVGARVLAVIGDEYDHRVVGVRRGIEGLQYREDLNVHHILEQGVRVEHLDPVLLGLVARLVGQVPERLVADLNDAVVEIGLPAQFALLCSLVVVRQVGIERARKLLSLHAAGGEGVELDVVRVDQAHGRKPRRAVGRAGCDPVAELLACDRIHELALAPATIRRGARARGGIRHGEAIGLVGVGHAAVDVPRRRHVRRRDVPLAEPLGLVALLAQHRAVGWEARVEIRLLGRTKNRDLMGVETGDLRGAGGRAAVRRCKVVREARAVIAKFRDRRNDGTLERARHVDVGRTHLVDHDEEDVHARLRLRLSLRGRHRPLRECAGSCDGKACCSCGLKERLTGEIEGFAHAGFLGIGNVQKGISDVRTIAERDSRASTYDEP